jgi:pimeloyl-ACP methyl ester carboxylesterase
MRIGARVRWTVILAFAVTGITAAQEGGAIEAERLAVPHVSTVPANRGERVELSVHHYPASEPSGAVVVVSSDRLPVDAAFGLDGHELDHLALLAARGLDVYAADVTGYGFSPRPQMHDACGTPGEVQSELLIPHPLYIPCEGGYGRVLTSLATDWDEIDAVVDFVIDRTGDPRVGLVGWGLGAARMGGYAALNPDKVERLALIAPAYDPNAPTKLPAPYPEGFPIVVNEVDALLSNWGEMTTCDDFAAFEEVSAALQPSVNRLDPVAAQWGLIPGPLFRSPGRVGLNGWNHATAGRVSAPTLIVVGESDSRATNVDELVDDLGAVTRLQLEVACGTHWLLWEATRRPIAEALAQFLATGEVGGRSEGTLRLDAEGTLDSSF